MHVPSEGSPSSLPVRQAVASDLPRLVALERAAFTSDRLSERSLRAFLKAPTAILLVTDDAADAPLSGYALILLRKGTGLARLYSLAVSPARRGQGLAHGLLQAAEDAAYEADRMVLRLEVREDNGAALALYRRAGYRPFERIPAYYEDGMAALRMQKHLRAETPKGAPAYYEQTTDFTCGPACALMALGGLGLGAAADAAMELRLWREATTVFMTSGLGGCDPYGLAVALARRGARTAIHINTGDLLFLESVRNEDKRAVMR
ncbi:MAG: peptidase C39 family protein, partial [Hyphomicrobiaceae bacterium]|nr:peptidase C39 family protein [Hyphomicrobiaceae bacterium]